MCKKEPYEILVVDDIKDNRDLVKNILKGLADFKYNTREASDGSSALGILSKDDTYKPDIIILDIKMEPMDGIEFLKELKKRNGRYRNTKTIVLSAVTSEKEIDECISLGAETFIKKFDVSRMLVKTIKNYLKNRFNSNYIESYR